VADGEDSAAMCHLTIQQLGFEELAQAWPLARTASHYQSCEMWRRSAVHLMGRGGGVIAIAADDGCFHGMATFEPITKPRGGRVLHVETMVTFELSHRAPVRRALRDALVGFARLFDCDAVNVAMPDRGFLKGPIKQAEVAANTALD
jgi:hypothetical protein